MKLPSVSVTGLGIGACLDEPKYLCGYRVARKILAGGLCGLSRWALNHIEGYRAYGGVSLSYFNECHGSLDIVLAPHAVLKWPGTAFTTLRD